MKAKHPTLLIVISVFLLAGCNTIRPPTPFPAGLQGMIYDNFNNPVSGVEIRLTLPPSPLFPLLITEESKISESSAGTETSKETAAPILPKELYLSSDIDGRFLLPDLLPGEYTLNFSSDGFESEVLAVRFSDPGQVLYVKMTSLRYLRLQIEEVLKSRDFKMADLLIIRAEGIEPGDPILLYLKALTASLQEKWREAARLVDKLKVTGFSSRGLLNIERLIEDNRGQE